MAPPSSVLRPPQLPCGVIVSRHYSRAPGTAAEAPAPAFVHGPDHTFLWILVGFVAKRGPWFFFFLFEFKLFMWLNIKVNILDTNQSLCANHSNFIIFIEYLIFFLVSKIGFIYISCQTSQNLTTIYKKSYRLETYDCYCFYIGFHIILWLCSSLDLHFSLPLALSLVV